MPELTLNDLNKTMKDSAYAAVGFGVLGFQRVQVRRRELIEQLQNSSGMMSEQVTTAREQLAELTRLINDQVAPARAHLVQVAKRVDEQVAPVRKQLDVRFDEFEARLPASSRNVFASIRSSAQGPESYLRSVVGLEHSA